MSFCNKLNEKIWKKIIETVALEIKKNRLMVEKDIVQFMFLYELSKSTLPFVFKGFYGDSFSKNRIRKRISYGFSNEIDNIFKAISFLISKKKAN